MGSSIFNQAAEFLRENKTAKRALGIMVCLALLVALGTVGVLTSTGQAMTKKVDVLDCVFVGHEHTADCYDSEGNVVCGYADYVVHVHNPEDCYDEAGQLVCTLPEIWPHTHTDECWQDVTELVCGETEDLGHTHSEACYSYELTDELICGLEEHTHDAACYRPADVLSCEIAEHTHSEECYDAETGELICETPEHTHDGTCYTQGQELVCEIPEHVHDDSCYKQNATLICGQEEREPGHVHSADCYKTERVLSCGKIELHQHTEDCYEHDEAGQRLGLICGQIELLEHTHGPECFKTVEVPVEEQAEPTEAPAYVCGLEEHTHSDACYDAESGELICGLEEHTHDASCLPAVQIPLPSETPVVYCGLEEHTHSDACYDEAGELICGLEEHTHDESCFAEPVVYYCGLEEHTHSDECYDEAGQLICGLEEHTHSDACLVQILIQTAEAEGLTVTAAYGPEANIPESAELKVEVIQPEGDTAKYFDDRLTEASEFFDEELAQSEDEHLQPLALLNVGFFLPDGSEVSPAAPVTLTVRFLDETGAETGEPLTVIHFADTGMEALETSGLDAEQATVFTTGSFSDFVVGRSYIYGNSDLALISAPGSTTSFEHNKTIDYLGDNKPASGSAGGKTGQNNGDTDADDDASKVTDDLYRLYLDMEGKSEPVDLVIVIDRSSSMSDKMNGKTRWKTVYDILEGDDGLLAQFLAPNEGKTNNKDKNFVSVVWFAGEFQYRSLNKYGSNKNSIPPSAETEGGTVVDWTSTYNQQGTTNYTISPFVGVTEGWDNEVACTNYVAGLYQADQKLHVLPAGTENHKKVVVFMSDGIPVYYYMAEDMNWNNPGSMHRYGGGAEDYVLTDFSVDNSRSFIIYNYKGNRIHSVSSFYKSPYFNETLQIFKSFATRNPNISFHTVAIDLEKEKINGLDRTTLLKDMAATYTGGTMYNATNMDGLKEHLRQIMFPSGVTIADELSAYVDLYKDNPDILVTATKKGGNGKPITLWKGPDSGFSLGSGGVVQNGSYGKKKIEGVLPQNIVEKVTYTPGTNGKNGTISVKFKDEYYLNKDYTYTLSFNVKLTSAAYDAYATNANADKKAGGVLGYTQTGDGGTDYTGNSTSSNKGGLPSNAKATVTYKVDGGEHTQKYDDPVVQAWGSTFGFTKFDSLTKEKMAGVPFRLERTSSAENSSSVTPRGKTGGTQDSYYKTNEDGQLYFGYLPNGTYTLYELVPKGYVGQDTEVKVLTFTVEKGRITNAVWVSSADVEWNGDKVNIGTTNSKPNTTYETAADEVTVTNQRIEQYVQFFKQDRSNEEKLEGAKFEIYYATQVNGVWVKSGDTPISTGTSDEYGWIKFSKIEGLESADETKLKMLYGDYLLVETDHPTYYDQLESPIHFKVTGNWVEIDGKDIGTVNMNPDGKTFTVNIYNDRTTYLVQLYKTNMNGRALSGAEFALYDDKYLDGPDAATLLWSGKSGDNGLFTGNPKADGTGKYPNLPTLEAGRTYYLVETVTPAGFNNLRGPIKIQTNEDCKPSAFQLDAEDLDNVTPELIEMNEVTDAVTDADVTTYKLQIENSDGYVLPRSGGEGVTLYMLGGGTLVALAGAMLLLKRRKKNAA